jgi:Mn-dependent DtxR family transcriptional regulator
LKYKKITQEDVYKLLAHTSLDFMNPIQGAINLINISHLLTTSRYQVKKHIDNLKSKSFVELKCYNIHSEDEVIPPYWGYILTNKGKDTDLYREMEESTNRLLEECFG